MISSPIRSRLLQRASLDLRPLPRRHRCSGDIALPHFADADYDFRHAMPPRAFRASPAMSATAFSRLFCRFRCMLRATSARRVIEHEGLFRARRSRYSLRAISQPDFNFRRLCQLHFVVVYIDARHFGMFIIFRRFGALTLMAFFGRFHHAHIVNTISFASGG